MSEVYPHLQCASQAVSISYIGGVLQVGFKRSIEHHHNSCGFFGPIACNFVFVADIVLLTTFAWQVLFASGIQVEDFMNVRTNNHSKTYIAITV